MKILLLIAMLFITNISYSGVIRDRIKLKIKCWKQYKTCKYTKTRRVCWKEMRKCRRDNGVNTWQDFAFVGKKLKQYLVKFKGMVDVRFVRDGNEYYIEMKINHKNLKLAKDFKYAIPGFKTYFAIKPNGIEDNKSVYFCLYMSDFKRLSSLAKIPEFKPFLLEKK